MFACTVGDGNSVNPSFRFCVDNMAFLVSALKVFCLWFSATWKYVQACHCFLGVLPLLGFPRFLGSVIWCLSPTWQMLVMSPYISSYPFSISSPSETPVTRVSAE